MSLGPVMQVGVVVVAAVVVALIGRLSCEFPGRLAIVVIKL